MHWRSRFYYKLPVPTQKTEIPVTGILLGLIAASLVLPLSGQLVTVWQVIRTSNGYSFLDPLDREPGRRGCKSENPTRPQNRDLTSEGARLGGAVRGRLCRRRSARRPSRGRTPASQPGPPGIVTLRRWCRRGPAQSDATLFGRVYLTTPRVTFPRPARLDGLPAASVQKFTVAVIAVRRAVQKLAFTAAWLQKDRFVNDCPPCSREDRFARKLRPQTVQHPSIPISGQCRASVCTAYRKFSHGCCRHPGLTNRGRARRGGDAG
jgi:hypothetical protein